MSEETKQPKQDPKDWVVMYCTSANCRGKRHGGKGFETIVKKGSIEEKRPLCNECFCR